MDISYDWSNISSSLLLLPKQLLGALNSPLPPKTVLFLEGKTLLQFILENLEVIFQKPCSNSTLYWGQVGREEKNAEIWQSVQTILASIAVRDVGV